MAIMEVDTSRRMWWMLGREGGILVMLSIDDGRMFERQKRFCLDVMWLPCLIGREAASIRKG